MLAKEILALPIDQRPSREVARGRWVELSSGAMGIVFEPAKNLELDDGTVSLGALIHLTDDKGLTVGEVVAEYSDIAVLYPDDPRVPEARRAKFET